jgi:dUTP pyrophosphatase
MFERILFVKDTGGYGLPFYATEFAAGMDLKALLPAPIVLLPMERMLIPTGLYVEIPTGCVGFVCPRSGLALKQGLTVLNAPGVIDSDYRGEVKVLLINLSQSPQTIESGDRIAQIVISEYKKVQIESCEELSKTGRGEGGFGSTGVR